MPRFSAFWIAHYKEIGNCCMTYPLKKHIYLNEAMAKKMLEKLARKQLVIDFIDVEWMSEKQLKWIGWDIQGWLAWTDPYGMLYRISDLERNEDGKEFEEKVGEVRTELSPMQHQGNPTAKELYTYERDMQKYCGFCPGEQRGSPGDDAEEKTGGKPKEEEKDKDDGIDIDKLMSGDISDFAPGGINEFVPQASEYVPIIDATEITETGHVNSSPAVLFGGIGGDSYEPPIDEYSPKGGGEGDDGSIPKVAIDPLPYLPPKPMPTPTPEQTKGGMPRYPTDTKTVTTPAIKVDLSIYGPVKGGGGKPVTTGTYAVTPTVKTAIQPIKPIPSAPSQNNNRNKSNFDEGIKIVLKHEGGWKDQPEKDKGDPTNKGISWPVWQENARKILGIEPTKQNLKNLTNEQAIKIYKEVYWKQRDLDKIRNEYQAIQIFDWMVNSGKAIEQIQKLLNKEFGEKLKVNNKLDEKTIEAINKKEQQKLYDKIRETRIEYYKHLVDLGVLNETYLDGLIGRAKDFIQKI